MDFQQQLFSAISSHFDQLLTPEVASSIVAKACALPDESIDPERFGVAGFGDYTIRAERFADVLDELIPLHEAHWLETERHRHGLSLNPDYDAMRRDERAGRMLQFTARCDGRIAAHLRLYTGLSRHTQTTFSQEDTLYLCPEHRPGAFLMVQVMRFAEAAVRSLGVREIRADSKLINKADVLMRRLGYTPVATSFVKIFTEESHDVQ